MLWCTTYERLPPYAAWCQSALTIELLSESLEFEASPGNSHMLV